MKLSIIIPVYNEFSTFPELLKKVESIKLKGVEKEIVIVDDYSTDGTKDLLKKLKHKTFFHKKNMGKGMAIRTALQNVSGDIILIQDADLEYNPENYSELLEPLLSNTCDVVYGSRFMHNKQKEFLLEKQKKKEKKGWMLSHYFGNKILTLITNILYNSRLTDMETCYKVFRKEILNDFKLKSRRFDFEPEITAKILKSGFKIKEVSIDYKSRDFKEGKKIDWRDGVKALYYLLKYRFVN